MANLQGMPGRSLQGLHSSLQGYGLSTEIIFGVTSTSNYLRKGPIYATSGADIDSYDPGTNFRGMKIKKGILYIVEPVDYRVSAFNRSVSSIISFGSNGTSDGQFVNPIAIDVYKDEIYVCDNNDSRVQIFDLDGVFLRKFGTFGTDPGELRSIADIHIANDLIYIAESLPGVYTAVSIFNLDGSFVSTFGGDGTGDGQFTVIQFNCVTSINNTIYVANSSTNTGERHIQAFELDGTFIFKYNEEGSGDAEFLEIDSIASYGGLLYVLDSGNEKITVMQPDMTFVRNIDISSEIFLGDDGLSLTIG